VASLARRPLLDRHTMAALRLIYICPISPVITHTRPWICLPRLSGCPTQSGKAVESLMFCPPTRDNPAYRAGCN